MQDLFRRIPFFERLDHHMDEVVRGASVFFLLKALGLGLAFGFNVALSRLLGPEGAGVYFLALTVMTIAGVMGRAGLDNSILRFVAAGAAVKDWAQVRGVSRKALSMGILSSGAAFFLLLLFAPWLAEKVFSKPDLTGPMRLLGLAIVPVALLTFYSEMLKGLKRIRDSQFVQGVCVPGFSLLLVYPLVRVWGVSGAIASYLTATVLAAFLGYILWQRATPHLKKIRGGFDTKTLLRSSIPLFWVTTMTFAIDWTSTFMLGMWGTKADVGIFSVAVRTAMLTSFVLVSVNSIAAPKFAELYRLGDLKALGTTARESARLVTVIALPVLLVFVFAARPVMSIFGDRFAAGATVLTILALGQFVNVATGSVGFLLIMSGHERLVRNNTFVFTVINVVLNALLIPRFGVSGAAVATALTVASVNLAAAFLVYKKLSIITLPIPWRPAFLRNY